MPRYNYSTKKWEKTKEEEEQEQQQLYEEQQKQYNEQLNEYYKQMQQKQVEDIVKGSLKSVNVNPVDLAKGAYNSGKKFVSNLFKTPERLKDGYNPLKFELTKSVLDTGGQLATDFTKGLLGIGEGIGDTINYGIADVADFFGADEFASNLRAETKKNLFNDYFKTNDEIYSKNSFSGTSTDTIVNSLGYVYGLQGVAGLGGTKKAQTLISTAVSFNSAYGNSYSEALNDGATPDEARKYALIAGTAEAGSELMFGGLGKGTQAVGLSTSGTGLDTKLAEALSKKFKSRIMKNLSQMAVGMTGEGVEELVSGFFSALGKKHTYMKDVEWKKILDDENLADQFFSAFFSSGLSQASGVKTATKNNVDYTTGRSDSGQQIYDKMIENKTNEKIAEKNNQLKQKAIDEAVNKKIAEKKEKFPNAKINEAKIREDIVKNIDFEETATLTKKELSEINDSVDEAFEKGKVNINDIYEMYTPEETRKINELEKELNSPVSNERAMELSKEISQLNNQRYNKLTESAEKEDYLGRTLYNEEQKGTNFTLTKDEQKLVDKDDKLKKLYDDATKGMNNLSEAHNFVNALGKMSEQTDYTYRLTNSKELSELGYFTDVENAVVNGIHDHDNKTIYINLDSDKALNFIVGHETGHIFENTNEYKDLQKLLFEVAEKDGTLEARKKELESLYKNINNSDVDVELTNDLLAEKLFNDEKFIERLAEKPNLFTKIKDKIDDLVIQFKGTEEEKQLRKIQNKFLEVYRKNNLQKYVADADAKANNKTKKSTDKKVDYSIQFLTNKENTPFVWLDKDISNMNKQQQEKYVINYINNLAGQTIGTTDGDSVYIIDKFTNYKDKRKNKTSSGEFYYGPTQYSKLNGINADELKNKILAELDNTIETSKYFKNKDDVGKRHSDYNIEKFDTRKSLVYDENNVYEIKLDVAIMNDGTKIAYDLKQIMKKNSYLPFIPQKKNSAYQMAIFQPSNLGLTSSLSNNIPQTQEKIKSDNADYSLSAKDNKGRTLTTEEQQKLRNSKARDEDGRLMELYHGTRHNFDEFTIGSGEHGDGFYFTEDSNYANEFADDENGRVIKAYLNLENPLSKNIDINDEATKKFINEIENKWGLSESEIIECFNSEEWSSDLGAKVAEKMGYGKQDVENTLGFEIDSPEDFGITDYNAYLGAYAWNNGLNDLVRESGFDGIISRTYNSTSEDYEYIAFNNNQIVQIKDNNNLAPIKTNNLNEYIADVSAREAKQNALNKESVRQSIIDYLEENNITNPTKEDMMNAFDDYDVMDNSDTLNNANKAEKLYSEVADEILKENNSKYPLSTKDSQGRTLSKEQQEYFKNSKARDDDGKLITFYHGTEANVGLPSEEKFTIFDRDRAGNHGSYYGSGFYFTTSLEDAKDYAHSKGDIYEVYLNIENPYIPSSDTINSDGKVEFAPSFYQDFENRFKDQLPQYWNDDTTNKGRVVRNILQDNGYDGVINGNTYVVFESNQIKNIDNKVPTDNPDIRYSLSTKDNHGNELSKQQQEYFKDSKLRDEDGNLKVMYRGGKDNINVFDTNHTATRYTNFGTTYEADVKGFFFTENIDYAKEFGNVKEYYLNLTKPLTLDNIDDLNKIFMPMLDYMLENEDIYKWQYDRAVEDNTIYRRFIDENGIDWQTIDEDAFNKSLEIMKELGYDGFYTNEDNEEKAVFVFNSNQIKSVDNTNPTDDADIRYSLSKNNNYTKEENELIDKYTSKYIGMNNRQLNKEFTYANDSYQEMIKLYNDASKEYKEYQKTEDFLNALHNYNFESEAWKKGDEYADKIRYYDREAKRYFAEREAINNILLGQDVDTRSKEEIVKEAEKHFGITNDFKEAGYIDLNGKLLDFSGAHEGGTKGQRSLDHRQINEIDTDYDSFIADGNIRILPENGGINLEIEPNAKQYDMLRKYIDYTKQNNQDEIYIDVVTPNGYDSIRYNPNTSTSKIINDLKEYYETGKFPKKSEFADFIQYSLSTKDNQGRQLSNGQRDYFRMSKVIDDDGNLMVMYHGSNSKFTIFDITKSGESNKNAKVGFWFTPSKTGAENFANDIWYGDKTPTTYETYLNIEHPKVYETYDNTIEYNRLKEELKQAENNVKEIYNEHEYDSIGMSNVIAFLNYKSEENTIKTLIDDFGYTEESAREYLNDVERVKEARDIVKRLEQDVENARYTDSYEQFRTDIYKMAGKTAEDANFGGIGMMLSNENQVINDYLNLLKSQGYDGIIIKNTRYDAETMGGNNDQYVAFYPSQIKNVDNLNPSKSDDIRYSLSQKDNIAPIRDDIKLTTYDDLEAINNQYANQPISDTAYTSEVLNPMEDRSMDEVGNKNVKSYEAENPEVKPYFKEMAGYMLNDLDNSIKGERYATEDMDYMGTSRLTTDDIALLLDKYDYSYDDIRKGLNDIINGVDNTAIAKRLEILINDRLLNGYTDSFGYDIPANDDYRDVARDIIRKNQLAPIKSEVDYSAFDNYAPIKNELDRLDDKESERIRKKREQYQQQIEQARKVSKEKKSTLRKNWDNLRTLFVNENTEIDNLAKESGNKKLTYKADMLNNYVVEAENDINNYQTDYNGKEIGKSVKQLFEPAKQQGLYEAFNDYLINWSNIDRHKWDKGSLRTSDTSHRLNSMYEMEYPQFKEWAKDVWKYGKNALETMEQSGLIDSSLKKKLMKMYPHYVPFMDNADLNQFIGNNDEIVPKKTIKNAKGGMSTTEILPIEDALIKYAYSYRKSMRQNDLYSEIVNTLRDNEIDVGAGDTRKEATDLKESLYKDENGNYLKAYVDGDTKTISISNDLYRALKNDLKYQIKDLEDRLSLITKPVQALTKVKGNLVTSWSPTFIFKNFFKDFQDATFNSTDTKKFIKNYPSAFRELMKNDTELVRQFRAMYGSAVGQYTGSDIGAMKKSEKTLNPFKKFKNANEIIELAPRYAEFKASLENGASIEEAMYNAREVTTNFSRGGTITKAINRNGFNFINASTQGLSKFIRNFTGQNGAKGFTHALIKAVEFGVAPALFNELVFGSGDDKDEDYDALPDYIKDNYYLFKYDDNKFIRIPKGRALSVFGSLGRRTLEYATGEKDAFDGYLENTWNQIGINNPEESFLFTPFVQAKNNETWYGGDIVPTRLQDKPAGEQYDEKTDLFSKWLGEKLNISPKKINYVIDQYTGGIGDILLPFITPEAQSEYDNPLARALAPIRDQFAVNSIDDNKYVSDFYTNNDKLKVQANSEYATDEDVLRYKYSNSVSSELSALYKEKRLIQNDTSLSNSEKYKKAQAIKAQINEIAKGGLENYEKVNVVGNYGSVDDREYYKNNKNEWTKANEDDVEEMNKLGLTAQEKNNYYYSKNTISNITKKYKTLSSEAKTDEEKTLISENKKADIINTIKATNISNDAKAYLYDKYYGDTEKLNVITTLDINMDKYLDFELQNFKADKDANGKTIKNSKKKKMINYINSMDGTYGEKLIIYKLHNMSDDTYNNEIVDYINSQKISQKEKRALFKALGMQVDNAGNVRWE